MRLTYNEIAELLCLAHIVEDRYLTCAATDSREVVPGALFVCVPGSRVDGHDFARDAEDAGASALLASRQVSGINAPVLYVADTVKALGRIAAFWREKTRARVVGVTGTAGKTTVKELLARVLAVRGKTARNAMNYNNQIGMPRAVLSADGDEDFWVMETGISRAGDMEELARILRPNIGIVLNVGAGHLEGLGEKGVAWHKTRLLSYLRDNGNTQCLGLVSADYPDLAREAKKSGAPVRFFSVADQRAPYYGRYEGRTGGYGRYRLKLQGEECDVRAPFYGEYGAENAIAVAAAAHLLGLTTGEIAEGFAQAALEGRFTTSRLGIWEIIDDTYNANPLSVRKMLAASLEAAEGKTFVPVLGEMLELGARAAEEHLALGRHLAELCPAAVLWKGGHAEDVRRGLHDGGYDCPWYTVNGSAALLAAWNELLAMPAVGGTQGGVVLFKGSRGNRLEELLAAFQAGMRQNICNAEVGERADVL
ncbi:MAG: UDP-N-acetylmuramoyl-tripeptide-D-alanyl-D-alanine ligase [Candidatus Desulfovibrio kirbyi]|uniref:UDP-N-acetylmuramoyl-tripeptide--D-alanyl-D-alanine ligase n=1 Tax=Candidatus Desulfovibrio kirbyi TaxID=2696086 RepID=A0A6L2R4L5_9BACT|nr:MAG: UDP-N-acetylmuramoyl-tripeptide-D-alanyl-D-alanine ligase [Candidatus Desulfovibrio kirbyi]